MLFGGLLGLAACAAHAEPPSWRLFVLQRYEPHDGIAVGINPMVLVCTFIWRPTPALKGSVARAGCRIRLDCLTETAADLSVPALPIVLNFLKRSPDVM